MWSYVLNKEINNYHKFLAIIKSNGGYEKDLSPMNRFHISGYENEKLGTLKKYISMHSYNCPSIPLVFLR
jgi:hypothetical protein